MKLLREPLVHFLALGLGLFLLFQWVGESGPERNDRIVVTAGDTDRLVYGFQRTWQRPPTANELEGLVEDHIREEILYREGLALGLDRDDTIIRRRMRQKMEFLSEDLVAQAEPTDKELQTFLEENPDTFRVDPQVAFSQVYLNRERRGDAVMRDAERLLAELEHAGGEIDAASLGDSILLPGDYLPTPQREVARQFGREFAERILEIEPGRWSGPIGSSFGLHLVFVRKRLDGRLPELAEVRDTVQREWLSERRREANEAFYEGLQSRYTVIVEPQEKVDKAGKVGNAMAEVR